MVLLASSCHDGEASTALAAHEDPRKQVAGASAGRAQTYRPGTAIGLLQPPQPRLKALPEVVRDNSQLWNGLDSPLALWSAPGHAPVGPRDLYKLASIPYDSSNIPLVVKHLANASWAPSPDGGFPFSWPRRCDALRIKLFRDGLEGCTSSTHFKNPAHNCSLGRQHPESLSPFSLNRCIAEATSSSMEPPERRRSACCFLFFPW